MKTYNSPNYLCISMLNVHHLGYHSSLLSYFNFIKISQRLTYLTDQAQLFLEVCLLFMIFLIIICGCSVRNIQIVNRIMFYFILYFHFGGGGRNKKKHHILILLIWKFWWSTILDTFYLRTRMASIKAKLSDS